MGWFALLIVPLTGACLGRWTRWSPMLIGLLIGLLMAALALVTFGAMMAPAAAAAAALVGIVAAGIASIGAFLGWLRRKHVERNPL